jgi:hypothetical protein
MRRYTAAQARQRLAEVLDTAKSGEAVVIERRGERFRVALDSLAIGSSRRLHPLGKSPLPVLAVESRRLELV